MHDFAMLSVLLHSSSVSVLAEPGGYVDSVWRRLRFRMWLVSVEGAVWLISGCVA